MPLVVPGGSRPGDLRDDLREVEGGEAVLEARRLRSRWQRGRRRGARRSRCPRGGSASRPSAGGPTPSRMSSWTSVAVWISSTIAPTAWCSGRSGANMRPAMHRERRAEPLAREAAHVVEKRLQLVRARRAHPPDLGLDTREVVADGIEQRGEGGSRAQRHAAAHIVPAPLPGKKCAVSTEVRGLRGRRTSPGSRPTTPPTPPRSPRASAR